MSWPDVLLKVSACLQKSTLNAICRGWTSSVSSCFFSEVDFECYLSWTHVLLEVIAFLRCLTSMLDFDAICGVPEHLAILLFAFDA